MLSIDPDIRRLMALRAVEGGLMRLKWLAAATRFELAMLRHDRALRLALKAGFDPNQPRVPKGNSDGDNGQAAADHPAPALPIEARAPARRPSRPMTGHRNPGIVRPL